MIWIPVELILEIFRAVQKLIGRKELIRWGNASTELDQEYCNNLLAFALSSKEWTAIAQAELFRTVILKDRSKMGRFLEALRGSEKLRGFSRNVTSLNRGSQYDNYLTEGLDDNFDEIALYCPNVVEFSCYAVGVRLDYFRNMKKLDKLNVALGSIQLPSTSGAPLQPFILPITLLSLDNVTIPSSLEPSLLPLLRSLDLRYHYQVYESILLLLPQLHSLRIRGGDDWIDFLIQESTSLTSLSIDEDAIFYLEDASKTVLKEQIVELILEVAGHGSRSDDILASILDGSKVMKKVILDGVCLQTANLLMREFLETPKAVKAACKKKNIELWKENYEVGNGKVDLEK